MVTEGTLLWEPSEEQIANANITRYMAWLSETHGLEFTSYDALWDWSASDLEAFWASIWDFFSIKAHKPYTQILSGRVMPGAKWFSGAQLNYTEHALSRNDAHTRPLNFEMKTVPLEHFPIGISIAK